MDCLSTWIFSLLNQKYADKPRSQKELLWWNATITKTTLLFPTIAKKTFQKLKNKWRNIFCMWMALCQSVIQFRTKWNKEINIMSIKIWIFLVYNKVAIKINNFQEDSILHLTICIYASFRKSYEKSS